MPHERLVQRHPGHRRHVGLRQDQRRVHPALRIEPARPRLRGVPSSIPAHPFSRRLEENQ